jgi:hypothetical protein
MRRIRFSTEYRLILCVNDGCDNQRVQLTHIVDPFSGWAGRLIGALACGVSYTGHDTNIDLYESYKQIVTEFLPHEGRGTVL